MKLFSPNISGFCAIAFWASSALIVVNTGDIPPMALTSIASFLGFLFCLAYWAIKKQNPLEKFRMSGKAYALGIFGVAGYITTWLAGLKLSPAFEANTLNYMWPLFLVVFSAKVDRTSITHLQILGLLFGLVGCFFIFQRFGFTQDYTLNNFVGLLLAFSGALIWAIYSSLTKIVAFESDRVGIFLLITSFIAALLSSHFEPHYKFHIENVGMFAVILLGITRVSFVFWDHAMKNGDRAFLSSLSYLIPVLSVMLLALFGNVEWSLASTIGAILIVSGCVISNWQKISVLKQKLITK